MEDDSVSEEVQRMKTKIVLKRHLSILLSVVMVLSVFLSLPITAGAANPSHTVKLEKETVTVENISNGMFNSYYKVDNKKVQYHTRQKITGPSSSNPEYVWVKNLDTHNYASDYNTFRYWYNYDKNDKNLKDCWSDMVKSGRLPQSIVDILQQEKIFAEIGSGYLLDMRASNTTKARYGVAYCTDIHNVEDGNRIYLITRFLIFSINTKADAVKRELEKDTFDSRGIIRAFKWMASVDQSSYKVSQPSITSVNDDTPIIIATVSKPDMFDSASDNRQNDFKRKYTEPGSGEQLDDFMFDLMLACIDGDATELVLTSVRNVIQNMRKGWNESSLSDGIESIPRTQIKSKEWDERDNVKTTGMRFESNRGLYSSAPTKYEVENVNENDNRPENENDPESNGTSLLILRTSVTKSPDEDKKTYKRSVSYLYDFIVRFDNFGNPYGFDGGDSTAVEIPVTMADHVDYVISDMPYSFKMNKTSEKITEGYSSKLSVSFTPSDYVLKDANIKWTSSNSSVATVSSDGVVKGLKAGTATITATAANGKNATCNVTVSNFYSNLHFSKTPTTIKAAWNKYNSAQDYYIELTDANKKVIAKAFTNNATSYTFTGLTQGTKYSVKLVACYGKASTAKSASPVTIQTATPYKDLSKYTLTANDASYTGKAIVPYVTVKDSNGNTLVKDTDYTVSCSNNVNVSSNAVVTVTAKGNYTGKLTKNFTIKYAAASVSNFRVTAKTPTTITLAWNKSSNADGYQITINDITNKGNQITTTKTITSRDTLTYKITGVKEGNCYAITLRPYVNSNSGRLYGATACLSDVVYPPFADLSDNYIIKLSSDKMTYVGKPCRPSVTVKDLNNNVLKKDTDYTVSYSRDSIAGTAKVTVKGKGNYKGTTSKNYTIVYGTLATPKNFKVTSKLPEKIGLSWSAVTNAAGYTIEVRDITSKGNQILKTYNATGTSYTTYGLSGGHEYSIGVKAYFNDQNGGKHYGTSASLGDVVYTPCKNVDEYNISVVPKSCIYSGSAAKPSVRLTDVNGHKLVKDTDFTVSYSNNVNIGTATIKITGKGNYAGTDTVTFKITPPSMSAPSNFKVVSKTPEKITLSWSNQPQITGYQVEVRDITNKGNQITKTYTTTATTYTATGLTGGHEYSVSVKAYFQDKLGKKYYGPVSSLSNLVYTPFKNVDEYNISVVPKSGIYSGSAIKPSVRLTDLNGNKLVKDTDFTVSYSNNVNIGTATIKITGKGNYAGTDTVTFKITPPSMSAPSSFKVVSKTPEKITLSWSNQPQITGYQLDVRDITNKGNQITKTYTTTATTYTATGLTGGHEYAISVKAYFQDKLGKKYYGPSTALGDVVYTPYKYIYDYNVTMTAKSWVYTGNEAKPSVKVVDLNGHKLVKDTDYTVTYSNNVNIGTATAKITGKGNYAGSDTITFKIVAPSMSAPSSFKVVSKTSNSINLSWGGQPQITGYQIDVRDITNKGNQILKSYTTTGVKYTVSNLTKYHEYAINVRAYVQDKTGTKYYGPWASLGDTVYL